VAVIVENVEFRPFVPLAEDVAPGPPAPTVTVYDCNAIRVVVPVVMPPAPPPPEPP
jgi:hypothetical protein